MKTPKNQKEAFMHYMCKLDAEMVGMVLDDHKTYQDAFKDVFISKLKETFHTFIKNGDTYLKPYRGICKSDTCKSNGCSGYAFYGNKSKMYMDLIIEECDNAINDIYHCGNLVTSKKIIKTSNTVSIDIKDDERANFKPSIEFLITSQKYLLAYEELLPYKDTIIDKTIYSIWFEKYSHLYKSRVFDLNTYSNQDKFSKFFEGVEIVHNNSKHDEKACKALDDYKFINSKNETQLLKWLTTYGQLGQDINLLYLLDMNYKDFVKCKYLVVDYLRIDKTDFESIVKFISIYDKFYSKMLEKYTTFSHEQIQQFREGDSDMMDNIYSLTYHLKKRNIYF